MWMSWNVDNYTTEMAGPDGSNLHPRCHDQRGHLSPSNGPESSTAGHGGQSLGRPSPTGRSSVSNLTSHITTLNASHNATHYVTDYPTLTSRPTRTMLGKNLISTKIASKLHLTLYLTLTWQTIFHFYLDSSLTMVLGFPPPLTTGVCLVSYIRFTVRFDLIRLEKCFYINQRNSSDNFI